MNDVAEALERLILLAKKRSGQGRISANFLLAWWNGPGWGGFVLSDLFSVDRQVSEDMVTIFNYLAEQRQGIYPDAWGLSEDMNDLIELWRDPPKSEVL